MCREDSFLARSRSSRDRASTARPGGASRPKGRASIRLNRQANQGRIGMVNILYFNLNFEQAGYSSQRQNVSSSTYPMPFLRARRAGRCLPVRLLKNPKGSDRGYPEKSGCGWGSSPPKGLNVLREKNAARSDKRPNPLLRLRVRTRFCDRKVHRLKFCGPANIVNINDIPHRHFAADFQRHRDVGRGIG